MTTLLTILACVILVPVIDRAIKRATDRHLAAFEAELKSR